MMILMMMTMMEVVVVLEEEVEEEVEEEEEGGVEMVEVAQSKIVAGEFDADVAAPSISILADDVLVDVADAAAVAVVRL